MKPSHFPLQTYPKFILKDYCDFYNFLFSNLFCSFNWYHSKTFFCDSRNEHQRMWIAFYYLPPSCKTSVLLVQSYQVITLHSCNEFVKASENIYLQHLWSLCMSQNTLLWDFLKIWNKVAESRELIRQKLSWKILRLLVLRM